MKKTFSLKLNEFQESISNSYKVLRGSHEFSDVTLACQDDYQIEAHRVILSASSPFFMNILKNMKHNHPMIYMKGMKEKDLNAVLDFIYHGETSIPHGDLEGFLTLAEELQLKELTFQSGEKESITNHENETKYSIIDHQPEVAVKHKTILENVEESSTNSDETTYEEETSSISDEYRKPRLYIENNEELIDQINSMMIRVDGKYTCSVCGKNSNYKHHITQHIESNHLYGVYQSCKQCGKISRSRRALAVHMTSHHR